MSIRCGAGDPQPRRSASFKARNTLATLRQVADYLAGSAAVARRCRLQRGLDYDMEKQPHRSIACHRSSGTKCSRRSPPRRAPTSAFDGVDPRGLIGTSDEAIDICRSRATPRSTSALSLEWTNCAAPRRSRAGSLDETAGRGSMQRLLRRVRDGPSRTTAATTCSGDHSNDTRRDGGSERRRSASSGVLTVRARRGYIVARGKPPSTTPRTRPLGGREGGPRQPDPHQRSGIEACSPRR